MNPIIIGLSGKACAGKDTTAKILKEIIVNKLGDCYCPSTMSFAYSLKEIAKDLFNWNEDKSLYPEQDKGRNLLINIGNKMREIRPTVWADYVINQIKEEKGDIYLIPDVRYLNEISLIRNEGGIVVRVARPVGQLVIDSISETECDDAVFDYVIKNTEDLVNLEKEVVLFYSDYLKKKFSIFEKWEQKYNIFLEEIEVKKLKRNKKEV